MAYSWDETEEEQEDTNLVKQLRSQLKEQAKVIRARDDELKDLRPAVRKQSVGEILRDLGANPKVAGLVPADVEATKDAVSAWFESNKDLFGAASGTANTQTVDDSNEQPATQLVNNVDPEVAAAMRRMQNQETAPGSGSPDGDTAHLEKLRAMSANAKSSEQFFQALSANGAGG